MKKRKTVTFLLSVLFGAVCFIFLSETDHYYAIQLGLLGFLIGASMIWLLYFSVWFISTGFKKTAFPVQSEAIVKTIKRFFLRDISDDQEKLLVEVAGTMIMIAIGFGLVIAGYLVLSGVLFISGKFHW